MKFLLIYGVLFLLLGTKSEEIGSKGNDYVHQKEGRNAPVQAEVSSFQDIVDDELDFLILQSLIPAIQIDLSAGVDQSWNNLSFKILHSARKGHGPLLLQLWYTSEWRRMLSSWHGKSYLLYFLKKLII